jgi:hypothetical protein
MASAILKRPLEVTDQSLTVNLSYGAVQELGDMYYVPLTLDDVSIPDISVTAVSGTTGSAFLTTATVGAFDNVRVGDVIKTFSGSGSVGTSTTTLVDCYTAGDLKEIKYTAAYAANLTVKAGDAVSGTGIGVGAVVDKIDLASRTIYVTVDNTASGVADIAFDAPARVIAVSKSTEATNPNRITIDRNLATGPAAETLVIGGGVKEAVIAILQINPVDNTTGSRLSFNLGVHYPNATTIGGSATGLGDVSYATLGYTGLQGLSVDIDTFLTGLRVPRTT